ncbi:hypothetical protein GTY49_03170 [Streptomyces sp. SID5477]|nr:hypothetical protein [Streptomyces sp. SID5477]
MALDPFDARRSEGRNQALFSGEDILPAHPRKVVRQLGKKTDPIVPNPASPGLMVCFMVLVSLDGGKPRHSDVKAKFRRLGLLEQSHIN